MRGQGTSFARLTQVLGAVAQSGSAPRSHRGGQGFKSPQLHPKTAGQASCSSLRCRYGWGFGPWLRRRRHLLRPPGGLPGQRPSRDLFRALARLARFDANGKRIRKKVSGQTRTEVKDKLKALHSELDAGVRSTAAYTVEKAVADWLAEGLPGRTAKTVKVNRDSLRPLLAVIGTIPLRDLTVQDVRTALSKMAATHATRTLQKAHNCLTRALRHAKGQDLVRRNVSALVDTPRGLEGRPSQSLTLAQATALLETAESSRLHAFIVLCLLTRVRSEEARALTWEHVDLEAGTISVCAVGAGAWRHQDEPVAADAKTAGDCRGGSAQAEAASGGGARAGWGVAAGALAGVHHLGGDGV